MLKGRRFRDYTLTKTSSSVICKSKILPVVESHGFKLQTTFIQVSLGVKEKLDWEEKLMTKQNKTKQKM